MLKSGHDEILKTAAKHNIIEVVKYLVKSGKCSQDGYNLALKTAAMDNSLEAVKFLVKLQEYSQNIYDYTLKGVALMNNLKIVKYFVKSGKCSKDSYDWALKAAAKYNYLKTVKYLLESEKCSDDAIKEALFNQDGTLKEEFNGIKNKLIINYHLDKNLLEILISKEEMKELSELHEAQKEWYINKYVITHNLNKPDNFITFDQLNIIFKKIFNFESLLSANLIKYLDVHSYLNLVKASIDSPKRKAIEEEKGDKNSDNKNNEAKEEKEENGDKSTSKQYAPETVDEDFLMRVYGEYSSGKEFWEELKEILLANLSEIQKMMEINKPEIEISTSEINNNHPVVTLLNKESIEQEVYTANAIYNRFKRNRHGGNNDFTKLR